MALIRYALALAFALAVASPAMATVYYDADGTPVPPFVPLQPGIGPLFTTANPGHVTATLGGFVPLASGAYAQISASDALSHNVAIPTGSADIKIDNPLATGAYCTLGTSSSITATSANEYVPAHGKLGAHIAGSSFTYVACIAESGATSETLNIVGGSGLTVDVGGFVAGSGGGGGAVTQGAGSLANPWYFIPATGAVFEAAQSGAWSVSTGLTQAASSVAIDSASAGTVQLVAAVSGKQIQLTSWDVMAASGTFKLEYGTGSNCGTGTTELFGPMSMNGAQVGKGTGMGSVLFVPGSNALCAVLGSSVQYSGSVSYVQF